LKSVNIVSQNWESRPGWQLIIIRDFLKKFDGENIKIDFSKFEYSPPLLAVYFTKLIHDNEGFEIIQNYKSSYLQSIKFLKGFSSESIENWSEYLDTFSTKTYLPIIKFNTDKSEYNTKIRNNLISHVGRMIKQITKLPMNYYMALSYLLSELTDNIVDHSQHQDGWISFQYYPTEGFMDICLADSGIGILGSYKNYVGEKDYSSIKTHLDAVESMVKGGSTKSNKERGFGVHTSREMLIDGLKGIFLFLSGNALLINYDLFDFKVNSNGTLILLRIPSLNPNKDFNIYTYTE
jgi:hypothetical protein